MAIIQVPDDETVERLFTEYVSALGKVAYSWNYLQERLGGLFATLLRTAPTPTILAIWFSEPNDRAQRRMLRAAVKAGQLFDWPHKLPDNANDDILWLLKEADELSGRRDEAVHAPVHLETTEKGSAIGSSFFLGNPKAINLQGKELIYEFTLSEWRAEQLTRYAVAINYALSMHTFAWPDKQPSLSRELHRQLLESSRQPN